MSHFTTIETQVRDLQALKSACAELSLAVELNTVARGYAGNTHWGDLVIKLKGPYDIALIRQSDGTYGLTCDWYQGHVEQEVGANYGKLLQLYGVHKAQIEARKKGYMTRRQTLADGAIKLVIGGVR